MLGLEKGGIRRYASLTTRRLIFWRSHDFNDGNAINQVRFRIYHLQVQTLDLLLVKHLIGGLVVLG
jgi:hypothetical protein